MMLSPRQRRLLERSRRIHAVGPWVAGAGLAAGITGHPAVAITLVVVSIALLIISLEMLRSSLQEERPGR